MAIISARISAIMENKIGKATGAAKIDKIVNQMILA